MNLSQITGIGALPFGRFAGVPGFEYAGPEHRVAGGFRGALPRFLVEPKRSTERGPKPRVPNSGGAGHVLPALAFERALERERSLADRGTRRFSLIVLRRRPGHRDERRERRALGELAQQVANRLRSTDLVGRPDPDRVEALLTDTEPAGAHVVAVWVEQLESILQLDLELTIYVYPTATESGADSHRNGSAHGNGRTNGDGRTNGSGPTNGSVRSSGDGRMSDVERMSDVGGMSAGGLMGAVELMIGDGRMNGNERSTGDVLMNGGGRTNAFGNGHATLPAPDAIVPPAAFLAEQVGRMSANRSRRWPLEDLWPRLGRPTPIWKRSIDIVISSLALLALSPLFAVIAIAIRLDSTGPVFFKHNRAGRGGRPFAFYKFRSMIADAEERRAALASQNEKDGPIFKIRADPRVTRVGRLLRRWSLDELPQLWNVVKGDISLVGPRSPTFDEVSQYDRWHRRRLSVIGGITCTWQVSGRSEISFREWMRLDMRYIAGRSMWSDLKLLALTVPAVISGRGAC